jgi:hypothetical protein
VQKLAFANVEKTLYLPKQVLALLVLAVSESLTRVGLFKLNVAQVAYSLVSEKTFRSAFLGGIK